MAKYCLSCKTKITQKDLIVSFNPITKEGVTVYKCCGSPYIYEKDDNIIDNKVVVIDADSFAYKIGYRFKDNAVTDESKDQVYNQLDKLIYEILEATGTLNYIGLLVGKEKVLVDEIEESIKCFRFGICTNYKAKRPNTPDFIIKWGEIIREYLYTAWDFKYVTPHIEVDDAVSILGNTIEDKEVIIASIDKDLLQIPTLHFNYNTKVKTDARPRDEYDVGHIEMRGKKLIGHGNLFLAAQCLTGDTVDGISGWNVRPYLFNSVKSKAMKVAMTIPSQALVF